LEVRSGAGSFHVTMERVAVDGETIVLHGTVDEWDSRTILTPAEAWRTLRVVLRWPVIRLLLSSLVRGIASRRSTGPGRSAGIRQ
jgi:hypothetical protein